MTPPVWRRPPAWVSEAAQARWKPRHLAVQRAWTETQRDAVAAGILPVAAISWPADQVGRELAWGRDKKVAVRLNERMPDGRVRIWYGQGDRLPVPSCCAEAASARATWLDPVWPTFEAGGADGPVAVNTLLSVAGLRAIPHDPCRFDCEPSAEMGSRLLDLMAERFHEAAAWLAEMLSWPARWDARHGCLYLTTPLFRLTASTDVGPHHVVERAGVLPDLTPQGMGVTFLANPGVIVTETKAFARGMVAAASRDPVLTNDEATLNGFSNADTMVAWQAAVIDAAVMMLDDMPPPLSVLDLGCGTAALLRGITARRPDVTPIGIERDAARAIAASGATVKTGEIVDEALWPERPGLVLCSIQRLREPRADELIRRLTIADRLILYNYNPDRESKVPAAWLPPIVEQLGGAASVTVRMVRRDRQAELAVLIRTGGIK